MDTPNYEVNKLLDHLMESLQVLTTSNRVVGAPISVGDFTIVPLIQIDFGFGGGGGGGEETLKGRSRGSGEGGGAGGSVQPVALLVLHKEEVRVYSLPGPSPSASGGPASEVGHKTSLSDLAASIPEILSRLKKKKDSDS
jgi:uncharacterized spore protein YtfJ